MLALTYLVAIQVEKRSVLESSGFPGGVGARDTNLCIIEYRLIKVTRRNEVTQKQSLDGEEI